MAQSGKKPVIAKIVDGTVSIREDDGIYWIGDIDAARYIASSGANDVHTIEKNFGDVMASPKFRTVGGHCVVARGKTEGFKFIPYMKLVSPNYFPKQDDWETVDFGTAQTGGFGYTTVVPTQEGVNGWGVFYFQGMFGEFWHVDIESNTCELLRAYALNVQDFVRIVQDDIGIELEYCGSLGSV